MHTSQYLKQTVLGLFFTNEEIWSTPNRTLVTHFPFRKSCRKLVITKLDFIPSRCILVGGQNKQHPRKLTANSRWILLPSSNDGPFCFLNSSLNLFKGEKKNNKAKGFISMC